MKTRKWNVFFHRKVSNRKTALPLQNSLYSRKFSGGTHGKRVPLTSQPEVQEFLGKWKAPSETSETFCEFKCRRNVLVVSKNQFLKVKSTFKPDRIAPHENLDVIKHDNLIWKANCFSLVSKRAQNLTLKVSLFKNSIKFADAFEEVMLWWCFELLLCMI